MPQVLAAFSTSSWFSTYRRVSSSFESVISYAWPSSNHMWPGTSRPKPPCSPSTATRWSGTGVAGPTYWW